LEEEIPYDDAKQALTEPNKLLQWKSEVIDIVKDRYKLNGFVYLGGFENHRSIYPWEGHKLEIDETKVSIEDFDHIFYLN
jgi:hypothetical protein